MNRFTYHTPAFAVFKITTSRRFRTLPRILVLVTLTAVTLFACATETVEVTRVKILERRVIERILVTVEVTRIQRVVETPKPTPNDLLPSQSGAASTSGSGATSADTTPATATPSSTPNATTTAGPTVAATIPSVPPTQQLGEQLSSALNNAEQTLLGLQQALNSTPLPVDTVVILYDTLRNAPTLSIPDSEPALLSFHTRYREQIDRALVQATDLYNHVVEIQAGQALQTEVSPTHLSLAREAASSSTSAIQELIRALETFLAS